MARGEKYSDEIIEKAVALYTATGSMSKVAKELDVPYSTVKGWIKAQPEEEVAKARQENKIACARIAGRTAKKLLKLLEHRANIALKNEKELEALINEVAKSPSEEVPDGVKVAIIDKLRRLQVQNIKDIAIAMGTAYDKYVVMTRTEDEKEEKETGVIILPEIKEE